MSYTKTILLLSFWFACMPYFFFLFLFWLLPLELPVLCWKRMMRMVTLMFVPGFRGKAFKLSPLSMMLAMGLLYMIFSLLKYVLSIINLLRILLWKDVIFRQKFLMQLLRWPYDFLKLTFIGVWLLYTVVLASTAQQNESTIHIQISPPFWTPLQFTLPQCIR